MPPSTNSTLPTSRLGRVGQQEADRGGHLLGPPGSAERRGVGVGEDAELRVLAQPVRHGGCDQPGGDGVEPDARPRPLVLHALTAGPPGQRGLGGGIDVHRVYLGRGGTGGVLVVAQARGRDVGGPARLAGDRVRGEQHDGGGVGGRQLRPQTADQRDRAEVVDRNHQAGVDAGQSRHPGAGHDAVHHVGQALHLLDRRPPAGGGRQVGDHLGVPLVDRDDPVSLVPQQPGGGRADARRGAGHDVGPHGLPSATRTRPASVATYAVPSGPR